jgi:diguanylate cyclase (GGDEF)-like protein
MAAHTATTNGPLHRARRPFLLTVVFGVALVLVGTTASALVALTSDHLRSATLNATVQRDASLVELFVNENLRTSDLATTDAARRAAVESQLVALTAKDEILRIDVRGPDGTVLFSTSPGFDGQRPAVSDAMRGALDGRPSAALLPVAEAVDLAGGEAPMTSLVQEYLPVVERDGGTLAVMAIWRDATPLLARIGQVQRDVLLVVLGASLVLAVVLFLVFRAAQARISRQQTQLVEATRRDPLTGLLNHGAVVALLAASVEESRARSERSAVALIDLDNFTLLNETHGHAAGDEALRRVAEVLAGDGFGTAHIGRYGPDEFLLVWTDAGAAEVEAQLHRLRERLARLELRFNDSEPLPVSVSAGIAVHPEHARAVTELLSSATVALTEAKAGGGGVVRVAQAPEERSGTGSFDVLQGLVIAIDTKDHYTKRHSEDVARYAVFLAHRLGLDEQLIATIRLSGLLHDVGKIGIPDALLRKPGKLTATEYDIFKQHVSLGDAIVRDLPNLELVRAGIRHHHERWDGRGYLEALEGEAIPLVGRVLAVADAFSAMTTTRPYRKALPVEEALKRLGDAAGTQFQETLVSAFIEGIETAADAPLPGQPAERLWLGEARVA